jgi:hypothetical protein
MGYLIKGATIVAMGGAHGTEPFSGDVLVEADRIKETDEAALLEELRGHLPEFKKQHEQLEVLNSAFRPPFEEIHKRCCGHDLGINRFSRPPSEWYCAHPR